MGEARRIRQAVSPRHYHAAPRHYHAERSGSSISAHAHLPASTRDETTVTKATELTLPMAPRQAQLQEEHPQEQYRHSNYHHHHEHYQQQRYQQDQQGQQEQAIQRPPQLLKSPAQHPAIAECARLKDAMEALALEADARINKAEHTAAQLQALVVRQRDESLQLQDQLRKLIVHRSASEAQLHQKFISAQRKATLDDAATYNQLKRQLEEKQSAMDAQRDEEISKRVAAAERSAEEKWRAICERELDATRAKLHKDIAALRLEYNARDKAQRRAVGAQLQQVSAAWDETTAAHAALRKTARGLAASVRASRKRYALLQLDFKELSHFASGLVRTLEHNIHVGRQAKLKLEAKEKKEAAFDHTADVDYFNRRRQQLHHHRRLLD